MEEVIFQVQGSTETPYRVSFVKASKDELRAYCNCQAGSNKTHCKHRIDILNGDASQIISSNTEQAATVVSWLKGTPLENALDNLSALTAQQDNLKKALAAAKKNVSRVMHGG